MSSFLIIYNPAAGQGSARERVADVESQLSARGMAYELVMTRYPGHAIELAAAAALANDRRAIVAAGGDGTANEVLNGLMAVRATGATTPPLGVLCVGRGNDFAYGVGIPTDLTDGIRALDLGETAAIDVGHLRGGLFPDGRYFGNGIGIGFDTMVGFEAARMKRLKGFSAYLAGALKTLLFYYRAPLLVITTDRGEETRACIQVSVMNGRRMGGAFLMAPEADASDGLLDLCIAGTPRRLAMLGLIVRYLSGSQAGHPHITTGRTGTLRVRAEGAAIAVHADGETVSVEHSELEVRCVAATLEIVRPSAPDPARA